MREELKQKYHVTINKIAAKNGFKFTFIAESSLIEIIKNGVDRMSDIEYKSNTAKAKAEVNLHLLVETMANNGRDRKLKESLDYKSFIEAYSNLNALWPFW